MSDLTFVATCDNKNSYEIRINNKFDSKMSKPLVLVRCDKLDSKDNHRGDRLANLICDFLNSLDEASKESILPKPEA